MPEIDVELLSRFERDLDPRHPEGGPIPARVLGYGEISTVFEIDAPGAEGWAIKRMPMFRDEREAGAYAELHRRYVSVLTQEAGLHVPASQVVRLRDRRKGYVSLYIVQEKLPPDLIGHRLMKRLPQKEVLALVRGVLEELHKVFQYNRQHRGVCEVGLDGQVSNWCVGTSHTGESRLTLPLDLIYLDTSTPLMRIDGREQLNPELLLRGAPSFLLWLVRRAFLPEVMTRYYDYRRVATDLVANFHKEGRSELVPASVETVNDFFAEKGEAFEPLAVEEIADYYRFDALIWRVYLALRKLDRVLARAGGREYPYTLPEKIRR